MTHHVTSPPPIDALRKVYLLVMLAVSPIRFICSGCCARATSDGNKVTRLNDIEVGALPEAVGFTPDGRYIYVGNYSDRDFSILRVDGTKVTNTGKHFKVPGQPGSARMSPH